MACNRQPKQFLRFMRPKMLTTRNDKLIPKLTSDVKVNYDPLKFATTYIKRPDGRLKILSNHLTDLIKFERVELPLHKAEEIRGYTERLIGEAIRFGDCHVPTMELADFWIREKQLIHKLFKVLVPRYIDCTTSFTKLYRLGIFHNHSWERSEFKMNNCPTLGVLELRGNPLPPMPDFRNRYKRNKGNLANLLLTEARKEYDSTPHVIDEVNLNAGADGLDANPSDSADLNETTS